MTSREQRVRMLAYRIWESEGRPEGQEQRHWQMAERIVEAENAREEEHEWLEANDEPSPLEGEDPPAEPDEIGIDESRLPLDDPETEALKEEDTGVEVRPAGATQQRDEPSAASAVKPAAKRSPSKSGAGKRSATTRKTASGGANSSTKSPSKTSPNASSGETSASAPSKRRPSRSKSE
ncbi:DUF2934 domain-containing protein [Salinicola aestuarinus]|uniref:DUF2934 domain-containing protein n=1 Tax=Salinicola aestuarinus TaxID=1949082 RepID=UPI000DA24560|nr:DUF2934 domain-containing protein [Salinicola aestuarinus]